ncbi:thiol-disulfide isomerase/thioredoxin [Pedobacter africanus]|uniref:Thiol-disulfide isomerase/thioredoxin n=1 Tax=Pedobacter africanus TaxID=151894 RepID=A0ACC6L495_9SPHI|nr:TlpA disulfide reductase family protein [Pedobacter africanus]MDR6786475.1 thiol-disulfide isomerase/thioredoxin [Pedobacter africanus]
MQKTTLTIVLATLCLIFSSKTNAQAIQTVIYPINTGDKIPPDIWNRSFPVINNPRFKSKISLKDYGNKLIILDFWATYCHPCIESLDLLDSIKARFKDDLVVIPVLINDLIENGSPFMKKKKYVWPSIVGDTTLHKVVLSRYLTGFGIAWIKDGKLLAVPGKKMLTAENIRRAIEGKPIEFINRKGKIQ